MSKWYSLLKMKFKKFSKKMKKKMKKKKPKNKMEIVAELPPNPKDPKN